MGSYLDQAIERLREFEGSVPWMYLDTAGKVTVGVGSMLPDANAAGTLPFQVGARAATKDEIVKEFARVSALVKGRAATFYRIAGGLRLTDTVIDQRLSEVLEGFEGYLRAHLAGYERLPGGVKLALLDMIYNLGPGKLFEEYPKLIRAIEKRDWKAAASASLRQGPSAARNAWTKQQFLEAAKEIALQAGAEVERLPWGWIAVLLAAGLALLTIRAANSTGSRAGNRI